VIEFTAWPKIARLNRDIVITEKIDGTNAAIHIVPEFDDPAALPENWQVVAQSRTRLITPEADNFGFAGWVKANRERLIAALGPGLHFGEWWGLGIQRGYGLTERRFSLFNTARYGGIDFGADFGLPNMAAVPVLYEGKFDQGWINGRLDVLASTGSRAAPGFMQPEGIVVYHTASRTMFKVTVEGDEKPKGSQE
jgi:hypothetical protein